MSKKRKNGVVGKRRINGTGTLERRGDKWRARYYLFIDGKKVRKVVTITPEIVCKALEWESAHNAGIIPRPDSWKQEPIPVDAARLVLSYLSGGNGVFTREQELRANIAELEGAKAEREAYEKAQAEEAARLAAAHAVPILGAFADFEASKRRPKSGAETLKRYRSQYNQFSAWMTKTFPHATKLRDVTPDMAEAFLSFVEREFSNNTHNKYLVFLRMFWRVMRWNPKALLAIDPWDGIKTLNVKVDQVKHRDLTVDELRRIATAIADDAELRLLFALGFYTGLRFGDCALLRWENVDIQQGMMNVKPRKTANRYAETLKTRLHPGLCALLANVPPSKRTGYVIPGIAKAYTDDRSRLSKRIQGVFVAAQIVTNGNRARLFKNMNTGVYHIEYAELGADGKPVTESTGTKDPEAAKAIFKAKTGADKVQRARASVGFHSLRHTFTSMLTNANVNQEIVNYLTFHNQGSVEARYYHANATAIARAVAVLPNIPELTAATALPGLPCGETIDIPAEDTNAPRAGLSAFRAIVDGMDPCDLKKALGYLRKKIGKGGAA